MAFHVNPKTGNTGICKAKNDKCPFGGEADHFEDRAEAQKAYELKQEKFEHFLWKSKLPATKGSYVLASYDPMSEEVPVGQLWGNPVYGKFLEQLEAAEDGARLVIENGQVWEKNTHNGAFGNDSWKFVQGNYDSLTRLEEKKTYNIVYLGTTIQSHGARLEQGGARPKMSVEYLRDVVPNKDQLQDAAQEVKDVFKGRNAAPEEQTLHEHLDDYISERWSGLNPQQWQYIRPKLEAELGEPTNTGTEDNPKWNWSR
jgi:hypothetical protein